MPSRMSSAVSVTPLGVRLVRLHEVAHRLDDAAAQARSCVPPVAVGMPLT